MQKSLRFFFANDTMRLNMKNYQPQLINDNQSIEDLCSQAKRAGVVGLDTEFMREKAYFAELCLVQMSIGEEYFLIDTLALTKDTVAYQSLANMIADPGIVKVVHSCSQDVEVLFNFFNTVPESIFDTQLAAGFCGFDGQIGYANIVMSECDVELDKSQTRTNWLQRPLSDKQLKYAVNDVVYLLPLYEKFVDELMKQQRIDWFEEESERVVQSAIDNQDADKAYMRMNGSHLSLKKQQLLVFLSNLRERNAQLSNKPRPWILKDVDVYTIVNGLPMSRKSLFSLDVSAGFVKRNADEIIQFVQNIGTDLVRVWEATQPFTPQQKAQVKRLSQELNDLSKNSGVARSLIANRKDIESYISGHAVRFEQGWRAELIGDSLSALIE